MLWRHSNSGSLDWRSVAAHLLTTGLEDQCAWEFRDESFRSTRNIAISAEVEVAGVTRKINLGILADRPSAGDWVLIQSGFAIERIDEERARTQMELLNRYTGGPPMDDDGLASEDAEFDWDRMSMTRSNSGAEEE